jgi:coproporphyrinogen III oxidase-like Fe-S oxidoreductase
VFGLRTEAGVDLAPLVARYGPAALAGREAALERAVRSGLARRDGSRVRLTGAGFLIADELFVDLL